MSNQCAGITKENVRCKRQALVGGDRCSWHFSPPPVRKKRRGFVSPNFGNEVVQEPTSFRSERPW